MAMCTYSERAALPAGYVKVDDIVSRNDVGDTITILSYLGAHGETTIQLMHT